MATVPTWEAYLSVFIALVALILIFVGLYYICKRCNEQPEVEDDSNMTTNYQYESSPLISDAVMRLNDLLGTGKIVKLSTAKGLKQVTMTLYKNKEIRWQLAGTYIQNRKYKLDVGEILYVQKGKLTQNFKNLKGVEESCCLSLIFQSITLDIVAASREEREVLAAGFQELVDNMKVSLHRDI